MSATHAASVLDSLFHSAYNRGDMSEADAIGETIAYVEVWIPKKVAKPGEWDEAKCPTCGQSLSTHEGDGCYTHRKWMDYCPNDECHQKLDWDW